MMMYIKTVIYTGLLIILTGCADDLDVLKAVCSNDKSKVKKYLNGDFDVNKAYIYNDKGNSRMLLYVALDNEICDADDEMVKLIMDSGYEIKDEHSVLRRTAGRSYLFEELLDSGVDINIHTKTSSNTVLSDAGREGSFDNGEKVKAGYLKYIKQLIEDNGADPELKPNGTNSFIESVEQGEYRITGLVTYLRSLGYNLNLNDKAKEYYKNELDETVE